MNTYLITFILLLLLFCSGCVTNESDSEQINSFFKIFKLYKLRFFSEW